MFNHALSRLTNISDGNALYCLFHILLDATHGAKVEGQTHTVEILNFDEYFLSNFRLASGSDRKMFRGPKMPVDRNKVLIDG